METVTIEIQEKPLAASSEQAAAGWRARSAAYVALTKPRIALMLVLTAAAGFYLGSAQTFNLALFGSALAGIALLAFGVATLNQYLERETDALMRRTARRPLPTGRLKSLEALIFGVLLCLSAEIYLAWAVNLLTAVLGLSVIVGYVLLYTPLKTRTTVSTVIGAFPGAMPPLMGYTAASGEITFAAWVLFWILFLWQFPHFLAIAWMYREEYGKAGILMLPVVEPAGKITARQIVIFSALLLPVSLAPFFLGFGGWFYLAGATVLGLWFLASSIRFARSKKDADARMLLRVSIIYLPLLFGLLVLNRI